MSPIFNETSKSLSSSSTLSQQVADFLSYFLSSFIKASARVHHVSKLHFSSCFQGDLTVVVSQYHTPPILGQS